MQIIFEGQQVPGQFGTIENNYERQRWFDAMAAEFHLEIDKITFLQVSVISSLTLEFDRIPNSLYWEFRLSWRWYELMSPKIFHCDLTYQYRALRLSPLSLLRNADVRNVGATSRLHVRYNPIWYPIVAICNCLLVTTTLCAAIEFRRATCKNN